MFDLNRSLQRPAASLELSMASRRRLLSPTSLIRSLSPLAKVAVFHNGYDDFVWEPSIMAQKC